MENRANLLDSSGNDRSTNVKALTFEVSGKLEADSLFVSSYYPDSFQFPYNPDPLVRGNNYSIYDEMRDDDQVKVCLALKKDMVLNSGWTISCKDEEIKAFIESNLNGLGELDAIENGLDESLRDFLSAYDFGFSLGEIIYSSPKDSKSGKWELRAIKVRPPHSFIFRIDDKGTVLEIEQLGTRKVLKLKPEIFIHNSYQSDFGNPYGKSDLRAAHQAWKAKKFIFRMAMRYAERFAGATVIGRYKPSMSTAEISRLHATLRSIQDNTTLTLPEEAQVEFLQAAKDSSDTYNKLLHMCNMWIARSLLIPDLLGVSGDQVSGGSLALGKEHFKIFLSTIANDRLVLQKRITSKIVRPLVKVNFGDVPCEFQFKPIESGEEKEYLRLWVDAVNGRLFKPTEAEINHLRRKTGFPEGSVEVPQPTSAAPGGLPNPSASPRIQVGHVDGTPEIITSEEEVKPSDRIEEGRLLQFRKATPFENKVDFASIQKTLLASDSSIGSEVSRILKRMAMDLVNQVRERKLLDRFKPEAIEALEPKFRRELNSVFKGHFVSLFRLGVENAKKEILPTAPKKFVADDILPEDFEEIIRAESFKLAGDLSNEVRKKAGNKMFEALKNGTSMETLTKQISAEIDGYSEAQVQTILRTKTTEVFNAARKTFFETDEIAAGIIVGYQYSSVMDENTTEVCRRLDERIFDKEIMPPEFTPPLHWNAIVEGEKVLTRSGYRPIENIRQGDYVMTHLGNWRRVYDTMLKKNDEWGYALEIITASSSMKLTPDHPVLTNGNWVPAGCMRIGDHIFQTGFYPMENPVSRLFDRLVAPKKTLFTRLFTSTSYFHCYAAWIYDRINEVRAYFGLTFKRESRLFKNFIQSLFRNSRPFSPCFSYVSVHQDLDVLAPIFDARQPETSSDRTNGLSFAEMSFLNHGVDHGGVIVVDDTNCNHSIVVKAIRKIPYSGMVYNLAVESDESYVVNGVVVHNCRSMLVPVTKFEPHEFNSPPKLETLKSWGGNLVFSDQVNTVVSEQ